MFICHLFVHQLSSTISLGIFLSVPYPLLIYIHSMMHSCCGCLELSFRLNNKKGILSFHPHRFHPWHFFPSVSQSSNLHHFPSLRWIPFLCYFISSLTIPDNGFWSYSLLTHIPMTQPFPLSTSLSGQMPANSPFIFVHLRMMNKIFFHKKP